MTLNLIYSIWILRKHQIWVYRLLYDQFAAELNLQLKPQANDIKISPNLIYDAISPPIHRIWSCNWFWGDLHNNSLRVVFFAVELNLELKPQANDIRISPNLVYDAISPLIYRMKFQMIMRRFAYGSLRVVFLRQNWIVL
jgi:hypothetical protein